MSIRYGVDIDYEGATGSWSEFFESMKAGGRDFVVRHLQDISASELSAANTAGVDHVLVFFNGNFTRAKEGYAAGATDAASANAYLAALSLSASHPVYYAVLCDTDGPGVVAYFNGIASVEALAQIGVMAGRKVIDYLKANSKATYFLQLEQWQYGKGWHPNAQLRQTASDFPVYDVTCKKYEAWTTDNQFGQIRNNVLHPTAPVTVPPAVLTATSPVGLVVRWGRRDEDLLLRIKDENGNRVEYRGLVQERRGGIVPEVMCLDLSVDWDNVACEWAFGSATIGEIIRHVVENPSGSCPTGIICHVEEPDPQKAVVPAFPTLRQGSNGTYVLKLKVLLNKHGASPPLDENNAYFGSATHTEVDDFQAAHGLLVDGVVGQNTWTALVNGTYGTPCQLTDWSGHGKSVRTVLDEFAEMTGCRWTLVSQDGQWHFYFGHPCNWPLWDTLRDDVDTSTPGTERRVLNPSGEIGVTQTNAAFASRVFYPWTISPPKLPVGMKNWDDVWTESAAKWRNYGNGVVIDSGTKYPGYGSCSIHFKYVFTKASSNTMPTYVNLGYVPVPGPLCDMSSWYWGWLTAKTRVKVSTNQGIIASRIPMSHVNLQLTLHAGAYFGPSVTDKTAKAIAANQQTGTKWTSLKWPIYGKVESTENEAGSTLFDLENIHWLQLRANCSNPRYFTALANTKTWTLEVWVDQLQPVGTKAKEEADNESQSFVEAQAVTEGREQPVEMTIYDDTLPYQDATALAELALAEHYRTRTTLETIQLAGVVIPPVRSRFPLYLTTIGMTDIDLAPVTIVHKPLEDLTEITLGDQPFDEAHADAVVRRTVDRSRAVKK